MKLTDEELIDIWRYFQYCCLPSIVMARYAYLDYVNDIKKEKSFYRHEVKQAINRIGKSLEVLPNKLADVSNENVRYMNILSDNIEGLFDDETEELHRAIYISFRNAKYEHLDCLAALHYISSMLQIASLTYKQCCKDLMVTRGKDVTEIFWTYNLQETYAMWDKIVDKAEGLYKTKKAEPVDLNNLRVTKAIHAIRLKYSDVRTLQNAMRESYPWSPNYKEGVVFEESVDYIVINKKEQ
jgi:hypothetical protein